MKEIVVQKAAKFGLDYKLCDAIIQVESNYLPYTMRFEPNYPYLTTPERFAKMHFTSLDTEIALQKFSWGLFQIMGSTSRWRGFQGPMPALLQIDINLEYGCNYLCYLKNKYKDLDSVISSYNQGNPEKGLDGKFLNQGYVDKVLKIMGANK